jgi:hypothetical protein
MLFLPMQINAEKAPYLTDKLKIWMLPTIALVKSEKVERYVAIDRPQQHMHAWTASI